MQLNHPEILVPYFSKYALILPVGFFFFLVAVFFFFFYCNYDISSISGFNSK